MNHGQTPAIEFRNVSISFDDVQALKNISFTLPRGEMICITGDSGSGKSVLLRLALGFLRPDEGEIWINGQKATAMEEDGLLALRREAMGIVCGFFIGVALAGFSVGVGFVSGWYPPKRQGMALGVYGAGNIGQSLAAFGSPVLAAEPGFKWGGWTFGVLLVSWLALFWLKAQNAPVRAHFDRYGPAECGGGGGGGFG
jgi:nitrate/nitrite transporter NarK